MMPWLLWLALQPQEEPSTPSQPDAVPTDKSAWNLKWNVTAELELRYDSNILRLDDQDIRQLETDSRPDKFRIDSPDDLIVSPGLEPSLSFPLFQYTALSAIRARAHRYLTNSIVDHEDYRLRLEVGVLEVAYTLTPRVYRREYREVVTNRFESAFYREDEVELAARWRPFKAFTLRPEAVLRVRDYEEPFDFRDAARVSTGAAAVLEPVRKVEVVLRYALLRNESEAGDFERDTSYVEHRVTPGLVLKSIEDVELGFSYRIGFRRYTTNNSPAVDPGHRDRTDDRHELTFTGEARLTRPLSLDVLVRYGSVDSDLPFDSTATDEEMSWKRLETAVGVFYRF
ncbi:MAG: hypothetical protein HY716_01185 [Planctomycetes bacterium]|nr:hypothetical protein [Planctomycetota bacterium]